MSKYTPAPEYGIVCHDGVTTLRRKASVYGDSHPDVTHDLSHAQIGDVANAYNGLKDRLEWQLSTGARGWGNVD